MAETPIYQLPYPEATDVPDVPYWQKRLADKVEAIVADRLQSGTVTVTGDGNLLAEGDIVFNPPFSSLPTVILTAGGDSSQTYPPHLICSVRSLTTSGFKASLRHVNDNSLSTSFTFDAHWIATDL